LSVKSHKHLFLARELLSLLAWPVLVLAVFACGMRLGAWTNLLPRPRPALDLDRTILTHQAEASRSNHDAEILLIGDSSCLMNVDAQQLSESLGKRVLNLATLSYASLDTHRRLLLNYEEANPGEAKTIVLLMHPEALRLGAGNPYFDEIIKRYLAGEDQCGPNQSPLLCAAGVSIFHSRVLSRALPPALPGEFGRYYGFASELWDHMSRHNGSSVDPRRYDPTQSKGSAEFRISDSMLASAKRFREGLPDRWKIVTGLSPSPSGFVSPNHADIWRNLLDEWSQALSADYTLANLPSSLPDADFATRTHLARTARTSYAIAIAEEFWKATSSTVQR